MCIRDRAWSMLGFSSSWDTSTVSLTVVASRVSTALFTAGLQRVGRMGDGGAQRPRSDAPDGARGPIILRHPGRPLRCRLRDHGPVAVLTVVVRHQSWYRLD